MEIFNPSVTLQPFIKRYVLISTGDESKINRLLPDVSITLAFRIRGTTAYIQEGKSSYLPASVISGLRPSPRLVRYDTNSACVVVVFQTLGACYFFREPTHILFNESIALSELTHDFSAIEDRLQDANTPHRAIALVEEFLFSQLRRYKPDELVAEAVRRITQHGGNIRIHELARNLCISQDAFEKRFRKVVGSSAKHFTKTIRIRSIIQQQPTSPSNYFTCVKRWLLRQRSL
jgi:hypothetical protein